MARNAKRAAAFQKRTRYRRNRRARNGMTKVSKTARVKRGNL